MTVRWLETSLRAPSHPSQLKPKWMVWMKLCKVAISLRRDEPIAESSCRVRMELPSRFSALQKAFSEIHVSRWCLHISTERDGHLCMNGRCSFQLKTSDSAVDADSDAYSTL